MAGVRCVLKGRLFYPWHMFTRRDFQTPDLVNIKHEKGWWIEESEIPDALFGRVTYLPKQNWLSPILSSDGAASMNRKELDKFMRRPETEQATHVALLDENGAEKSRGLIVQPVWIERTEH